MICPVCNSQLLRPEKQGTGIDYCPKCDRLWLDRDITEKLTEMQAFIGIQNNHTGCRHDNGYGQN
jgi:Zn-finger nucleic acid-binding protein